jgi:L-seryl-tRNA(Ser) seleniumtransferase
VLEKAGVNLYLREALVRSYSTFPFRTCVMSEPAISKTTALRALPSVDQLLRTEAAMALRQRIGASRLTSLARSVTDQIRAEIQSRKMAGAITREGLLDLSVQRLKDACLREERSGIQRVINATGVILHTNLGRAPLSEAARNAITEASGYCTLEYDPITGSRGRRGARVEALLMELTGAEDALVVNNCAAAAFLILTVLAKDAETLVSRGELVEIGGDFRVPDVMANSGTRMVEVGTTNRTRLDDYRRAITQHTRVLMRVHQSNYRIVGFTTSPTLSELAILADEAKLILFEDAGSGALLDLEEQGLGDEPVIRDSIAQGADVISFSGDKLLGATQAGLIVGKREIVDRLRKHSLYRALRVDKLTLAALEATLEEYSRGVALNDVPALRMLALPALEIEQRVHNLVQKVSEKLADSALMLDVVKGESAVGGGSGPNTHPETTLISLQHKDLPADQIQARLRSFSPPVIARIADGKVLLDLRTVNPGEELDLIDALCQV